MLCFVIYGYNLFMISSDLGFLIVNIFPLYIILIILNLIEKNSSMSFKHKKLACHIGWVFFKNMTFYTPPNNSKGNLVYYKLLLSILNVKCTAKNLRVWMKQETYFFS